MYHDSPQDKLMVSIYVPQGVGPANSILPVPNLGADALTESPEGINTMNGRGYPVSLYPELLFAEKPIDITNS
jgi:hypothetical protein